MNGRFISALVPGLIVSLFLFWLMNYMIMPEEHDFDEEEVLQVANFTRLKSETRDKQKGARRQLPEMQEVQQKPSTEPPPAAQVQPVRSVAAPKIDAPQLDMSVSPSSVKITMTGRLDVKEPAPVKSAASVSTPAMGAGSPAAGAPGMDSPSMDAPMGGGGDVVPRFRVEPTYPRRARMKRIEGWVKVQFTITTDGSVDDIDVIEAEPSGIFENAVLRALSRWEFDPRMRNGQPIEQRATQTLTFSLTQ